MPRYFLSGVGLLAFAALSGFHFLSLWQVASYYLPDLLPLFAVVVVLVWLGGLGLVPYAVKRNKLKKCLLGVFFYVMAIILAGTRALDGVPAEVGEGNWRDPQQRLTPGSPGGDRPNTP